MGDAGGDPDWYGYCLDDPVNGVDPLGLAAFLLPFLAGTAGATGLAALGSGIAGLAADGFGALTGANEDEPLKATKGAMKGMAGAAAVQSGIAAGATGAVGAAKAGTVAAATAPSLIRQGKEVAKMIGDKADDLARNPNVHKPINAAGDFISAALPGGPPASNKAGISGFAFGDQFNTEQLIEDAYSWFKEKK